MPAPTPPPGFDRVSPEISNNPGVQGPNIAPPEQTSDANTFAGQTSRGAPPPPPGFSRTEQRPPARYGGPGDADLARAAQGELEPSLGDLLLGSTPEESGRYVTGVLPSLSQTLLGEASLGDVATRILPNTAQTIGATTTEMATGAQIASLDQHAATLRQNLQALGRGGRDFGLPNRAERFQQLQAELADVEAQRDSLIAVGEEARAGGAEAMPQDAGILENAVQQGAATSALVVPAALATGGTGAAAILGAGTGAQRYGELVAEGIDPQAAGRSAMLLGALETLTEYLPAEALLKRSSGFAGFKAKLAEFFASELPGENANTIAQMVDDYANGLRDDLTIGDITDAMADTTLQTVVGGGMQVGAVQGLQALADRINGTEPPESPETQPEPPGAAEPPGGPSPGPGLGPEATTPGSRQAAFQIPGEEALADAATAGSDAQAPIETPPAPPAGFQRAQAPPEGVVDNTVPSAQPPPPGAQPVDKSVAPGDGEGVPDLAGATQPKTDRDLEFALEQEGLAVYRVNEMDETPELVTSIEARQGYPLDSFYVIDKTAGAEPLESTQQTATFRTLDERAAAMRAADRLSFETDAARRAGTSPVDEAAAGDFDLNQVGEEYLRQDSIERGIRDAEDRELGVAVADIFEGYENAPGINFVQDVDGLPAGAARRIESASPGMVTKGVFDSTDNQVYLFTGAIKTPEDAAWVAAHEIAGHYGLRGSIGSGKGRETARARLNQILEVAQQNDTIAQLSAAIGAKRRGLRGLQSVEEALSELAAADRTGRYDRLEQLYGVQIPETAQATLKGALKRLIERIKALFKSATGVTFSDQQVRDLLEGAWRYVRKGETIRADSETTGAETDQSGAPSETTGAPDETPAAQAPADESRVDPDGIEENLERYLAESPDQSQADAPDLDDARQAAVEAVRSLYATGSLFAQEHARKLSTNLVASIVGQTIETHADLALAAQIYRDRRFETLRVFFTDDAGTVVGQVGLTQRMPAGAPAAIGDMGAYLDALTESAQELGATQAWMQHAHPSGDAQPSMADEAITTVYAQRWNGKDGTLRLAGHVVLNHNHYYVIAPVTIEDASAGNRPQRHEIEAGDPDLSALPIVSGPARLADVARMVELDPDAVTFVLADNRHRVRQMRTVPVAELPKTHAEMRQYVDRMVQLTPGISERWAIGTSRSSLNLVADHVLDTLEINSKGEYYSFAEHNVSGGRANGSIRNTRLTGDTSGQFDYLRDVLKYERELTAQARGEISEVREPDGGQPDRREAPRGPERRQDPEARKRVDEMTADELRRELLQHEVTGIPNRRAYEEAEKLPVQAAIDVDSLKWVNDNMGHESGDQLLRAVATALADETDQAFHISGDEFVLQAETRARANALMRLVQTRLAQASIEIETAAGETVTLKGIGLSYGLGEDLNAADQKLAEAKTQREERGERAARGEAPRGAERRPAGRQNQVGDTADEELQLSEEVDDSVTETPAFKRWFGDSKVVDESGKPIRVFHGTKADFEAFKNRDIGFHFGAIEQAEDRSGHGRDDVGSKVWEPGERFYPVYLKIENPLETEDAGAWDHARDANDVIRDALEDHGLADEFTAIFAHRIDALPTPLDARYDVHTQGRTMRGLIAEMRAWLKSKGFDGIRYINDHEGLNPGDYTRELDKYAWIAFDPNQIKSASANQGTFDPKSDSIVLSEDERTYVDDEIEKVKREVDAVEEQLGNAPGRRQYSWNPGPKYVPLWLGRTPSKPTAARVRKGQIDPNQVKHPIRREHVMELFQRLFRLKIYQGKPFQGRALGFFRPSNFEIRIKAHNDLEVAAHEVFHWIDRTFPKLRKLYHEKRFAKELKGVSYDIDLIFEGFAEFGRLYMTNEVEAITRAPKFYEAFVETATELGIIDKLDRVQRLMHLWYLQGAAARAQSKIGKLPLPLLQRMAASSELASDKMITRALDHLHPAKVIERETKGEINADAAWSPYKSLRLLAGVKSTTSSFLNYGTLGWSQNGDLRFTGKSLKQVLDPIGDVLDDGLAFFAGRRAEELMKYGKERLFTRDEVQALLDRGRNSPKREEIEQAFRDYQGYVSRLLDFAEQSGILNDQTRAKWEELYKNYVPFYRVADRMGQSIDQMPTTKSASPFRRLYGGTSNLRDILDNMTQNTAVVVNASMRNMSKRLLFASINSSPLGQRYAVHIPKSTEVVKVSMDQVARVLKELAKNAEEQLQAAARKSPDAANDPQVLELLQIMQMAETLGTHTPAGARSPMVEATIPLSDIQAQAAFFLTGRPPKIPDKDFVLINGKPTYFQIGDQMLWDMLSEINYSEPLGLAEQTFGLASRTLRRSVTLEPTFMFRNLIRDTFNAFTMSRGGQWPVLSALRAMKDVWTESEDYQLFMANGGGYGMMVGEEARRLRTKLKHFGADRYTLLAAPHAAFDVWDKWGWSFELATRLAEFKRIRAQGKSLREAAYQGREISTDFAMRGSSATVRFIKLSTAFWNARIQGLYRLERELFERKGRQAKMGERALHYSMRAVLGLTFPALIAYWLMRDDDDYKDLPEDIKSLYTVLPRPGGGVYLIPRPFETGALFQELPVRLMELYTKRDGKKMTDAMLFMIAETFSLDPTPTLVQPIRDVIWRNRTWNGFPIVPQGLEDVSPAEQFQPWTSETFKRIGKMFDVSPLKLEALYRGYLAEIGMYGLAATDAFITLDEAAEDPAKRLDQYPVVRGFMREQPYRNTSYEQSYYDMLGEVTTVIATARKLRREGRGDDLDLWLSDPERALLAGLADLTEDVSTALSRIRAARNQIYRATDYTPGEKQDELDQLQTQENELFRSIVEGLSDAELEQLLESMDGFSEQSP